jgi:hypothetical protein
LKIFVEWDLFGQSDADKIFLVHNWKSSWSSLILQKHSESELHLEKEKPYPNLMRQKLMNALVYQGRHPWYVYSNLSSDFKVSYSDLTTKDIENETKKIWIQWFCFLEPAFSSSGYPLKLYLLLTLFFSYRSHKLLAHCLLQIDEYSSDNQWKKYLN